MKSSELNKAVEISQLFRKIISGKTSMATRFNKVIAMIADEMQVDAAACFLVIDDNYLELFASKGLNPKVTNNIALKVGEGIVGKIAASKCTQAIEDIWQHPDFYDTAIERLLPENVLDPLNTTSSPSIAL